MTDASVLKRRTAGNENTDLLKLIALLFMIVDHTGAAFFPQCLEMRLLGRIAFPLYAWCLAVGAEYTRNIWKYALRLLIVGVISQPVYVFAMRHQWMEWNIFATLLLGLLGIAGVKTRRLGSQIWAPALAILISCAVDVDYGWKGVCFILLLYAVRGSRPALSAFMIAFCLYWGQGTITMRHFGSIPFPTQVSFLPLAGEMLSALARIQFYAVLALPLMAAPMRRGALRMPAWLGYALYPAHLAVIGLIRNGLPW